jgi:hypothetical protein
MIYRIITPVPNAVNTLGVIAIDINNMVVIKDIVENVAGTPSDDLLRQLWRMQDINGAVTFQNLYNETYLSYALGMHQKLIISPDQTSIAWSLVKKDNMPSDSPNAPRSFAIKSIQSSQNNFVGVADFNTSDPGNIVHLWEDHSNQPYNGQYNQRWYLEVPRILIVNPNGNPVTITASDNKSEVIEVWDSAIGGNLLGTISSTNKTVTVQNQIFYLSSKRIKGSYKVNECANERNQAIDLSQNPSPNFYFYYDDPERAAKVTISTNLSR